MQPCQLSWKHAVQGATMNAMEALLMWAAAGGTKQSIANHWTQEQKEQTAAFTKQLHNSGVLVDSGFFHIFKTVARRLHACWTERRRNNMQSSGSSQATGARAAAAESSQHHREASSSTSNNTSSSLPITYGSQLMQSVMMGPQASAGMIELEVVSALTLVYHMHMCLDSQTMMALGAYLASPVFRLALLVFQQVSQQLPSAQDNPGRLQQLAKLWETACLAASAMAEHKATLFSRLHEQGSTFASSLNLVKPQCGLLQPASPDLPCIAIISMYLICKRCCSWQQLVGCQGALTLLAAAVGAAAAAVLAVPLLPPRITPC